jgi:uncharacterized protein
MAETIDWPPRRPPRRGAQLLFVAVLGILLVGGGTALSYYVDALWFASLGYAEVFWKSLSLQGLAFAGFFGATFVILYGSFLLLKPARLADLATSNTILINGQPLSIPVEPVLRLIAVIASLVVALGVGTEMMSQWTTFALYWYAPQSGSSLVDPVFGRPLAFYLFTLPAWQLVTGWLVTLTVIVCLVAGFFVVITGGARMLKGRQAQEELESSWRGLSIGVAALLLLFAARTYLGRFSLILADHTIFSGITYTDEHVTVFGMLLVAIALVLGAMAAMVNAVAAPRLTWLVAAVVPAAVVYVAVALVGWYVNSFLVKPNELVREQPYIQRNIELTRQAFALDRIAQHPFPGDSGVEAMDAADNRATLENIQLWDRRALQDTLRQIQEIRTYYDFPSIDIDRYHINGVERQVMLATREVNVQKLPESSRNWINEKLVYTHGYGLTMNPVNGFTPEGLPQLMLSNMPVQSTVPGLTLTRPEIYFGELTDTDVYVKTRQKEFNYPQGETNNLTTYDGTGGIAIGGFLRRLLIAVSQGDLAKLPFSDDVTADSRLLMRRNIRDRVQALAPFLTIDPDPYIVVRDDGRLSWILDGFTWSDTFPYSRHYRLGDEDLNYLRNSVKIVVDAYEGSVEFYVYDSSDPIVNAYRAIFPALFKDASAMPADLRQHVRYPELMLELQAAVYGLYHMTDSDVFYNREDLWTVATQVGLQDGRQNTAQPVQPNFLLMKLPDENQLEYVEILPFTPANRNNLIGWIAGRSDEPHYGTAVVFDFPKTKLVDGPLQIEARIDQNAQLSGQLTLWNQQGSHVQRGNLLVIPIGRALLYAEPIYLQAERSPMPELRLVVLALQDKLAYGPTFESALSSLFGGAAPSLSAPPPERAAAESGRGGAAAPPEASGAPAAPANLNALIESAARDFADYQRLTSEGRLGEAGRKLEDLKQTLQELQKQR